MKAVVVNIDDVFMPKIFGVILKEKPKKFILELHQDEAIAMRFFNKKYDLRIDYNGEIYYLSENQYESLKELGYEDLSVLGITYRDADISTKESYTVRYSTNIAKKLASFIDYDLYITSNINDEKLVKLSVATISKYLNKPATNTFIYETYKPKTLSEQETFNSQYLVLSLLLGKKIENKKITDTEITKYNEIKCYNIDISNIRDIISMTDDIGYDDISII